MIKFAIVLYSNNSEIVWNAFRLAIFSQKQGDDVKIFLLAEGVEVPNLQSDKYNISQQIEEFIEGGGEIMSCTTCIQSRNMEKNDLCPLSTLQDLYSLIQSSDKVITF